MPRLGYVENIYILHPVLPNAHATSLGGYPIDEYTKATHVLPPFWIGL